MNKLIISQSRVIRWFVYFVILIVMIILVDKQAIPFTSDNGFDLSNTLIPRDQIYHGGPTRDGIPSIDQPHFVRAQDATYLNLNDRILGLVYDGVIRAYPIKIMNYHEIVNDTIKRQTITISYCPLCGSGVAFKPEFKNQDNNFGVSGLLYNSDMLLYDRATHSLWSQIMGLAISGQLRGTRLTTLSLVNTSWASWQEQYPDTEVLSTKTGYSRNYNQHPYGDYDVTRTLYFPVSTTSKRYHPKERVIGIIIDNKAKAYPVSELAKQQQAVFGDVLAGKRLTIKYDAVSQSATIYDEQQRLLPSMTLFWFAWIAFYPDTKVFSVKLSK